MQRTNRIVNQTELQQVEQVTVDYEPDVVLAGRLSAAFKASEETDKKLRTVPNLLGILEMKVADIRASEERHGGKNVLILISSVRAYADLLEVAVKERMVAQRRAHS